MVYWKAVGGNPAVHPRHGMQPGSIVLQGDNVGVYMGLGSGTSTGTEGGGGLSCAWPPDSWGSPYRRLFTRGGWPCPGQTGGRPAGSCCLLIPYHRWQCPIDGGAPQGRAAHWQTVVVVSWTPLISDPAYSHTITKGPCQGTPRDPGESAAPWWLYLL